MRWLLIAASIAGFALIFSTHSMAVLVIGLLLATIGVIGTILHIVDSRMGSNSRNESTLLADREVARMRAASLLARAESLKAARAATQQPLPKPPAAPAPGTSKES